MKFLNTSAQVIFDSRLDYFQVNITAIIEDEMKGFQCELKLCDQRRFPIKTNSMEEQVSAMTDTLDDLKENHPYFLLKKCESPIEVGFYVHALHSIPGLKPQIQVGPYRVDFAIPAKKYYIELDGYNYHSSREQRTNDAKRDRYLLGKGWKVIRFTGSEVNNDPQLCIDEVKKILN